MLKQIRQLHLYLGTFFAPAIIFFALTGALQTFGLHENKNGTNHPAWIAKLAEVHKDQHLSSGAPERPPGRARRAEGQPPAGIAAGDQPRRPPEEEEQRGPSPLPLKIFVLFMAVGLITTTLLGIYMSFKYNRNRRIVWGLLIGGTVLPLVLLFV